MARRGDDVVGVCGLNVDPYSHDPAVGRVRRLYVMEACRHAGVGRRLVEGVMNAAAGHFRRLRVRTENPRAGRLFERLGFVPTAGEPDCTHAMELAGAASRPLTRASQVPRMVKTPAEAAA